MCHFRNVTFCVGFGNRRVVGLVVEDASDPLFLLYPNREGSVQFTDRSPRNYISRYFSRAPFIPKTFAIGLQADAGSGRLGSDPSKTWPDVTHMAPLVMTPQTLQELTQGQVTYLEDEYIYAAMFRGQRLPPHVSHWMLSIVGLLNAQYSNDSGIAVPMDVVSASIPYPSTNNYSAFMLSAFAAPNARILYTDDPLLFDGQLENTRVPRRPRGKAVCSRMGGAVVGWNYFMVPGPLHLAAMRLRAYEALGIPLQRPRPSRLKAILVDRAKEKEQRSFLNATRIKAIVDEFPEIEFIYVQSLSGMGTQQIALFADADIVMLLHGAAMSNVVWCRPRAVLIELVPFHWSPVAIDFSVAAARVLHLKVSTHRPDQDPYNDGMGPLFSTPEQDKWCMSLKHSDIIHVPECRAALKWRRYSPVEEELRAALARAVLSIAPTPSDDFDV